MDPQQEIFTELLMRIKKLGYDVYDGELPPKNTPYPFVYIADSQQDDKRLKNAVIGNVNQRVHVWHNNAKQRGTVSKIMLDVKRVCYQFESTAGWSFEGVTERIISDGTTKEPLLHGVLDLEFRFSS